MKAFFLATLPEVKDIKFITKDLGKLLKDVVVDETRKNLKQIKTQDHEEDEVHFPTSNHTNFEEETNETLEEEIIIEEKTLSRYV